MTVQWLAVRNANRERGLRRARQEAQRGFTLLEVLVVLVILGLLAAVVAGPQIFKYLGSAKSEAAKVQVQQIGSALDLYRLEVGRYPTQQESLTALLDAPAGVSRWNGPYMKKKEAIIDPWGRQFLYKAPGDHGDYDLYTLGADNTQGGDGENQDITSW